MRCPIISVRATIAIPTPVDIIKLRIASFKVSALTAAPRMVAEHTSTIGENIAITVLANLADTAKILNVFDNDTTEVAHIAICADILI